MTHFLAIINFLMMILMVWLSAGINSKHGKSGAWILAFIFFLNFLTFIYEATT